MTNTTQVGEYVSSLLSQTRLISQDLFLTASAAAFVQAWRVVGAAKEVVKESFGDDNASDNPVLQPSASMGILDSVGKDAESAV